MNDFTGKLCPYCKTEFRQGDDIVVCSQCDMPHHKDCWIENQGCTTFGCLGTIKAADQGASSVTATYMNFEEPGSAVFCTQCGTRNEASSAFCTRCGSRLAQLTAPASRQQPAYTQPNPVNANPYSYGQQPAYTQPQTQYGGGYQQPYQRSGQTGVAEQLIGPNADYYTDKFRELEREGRTVSWNWAAFWLSAYWFFYRKMYGYGAAILGGALLLSLVNLGTLAGGAYVVLALFANTIYRKRIEKLAGQANAMAEPYRREFIEKNGGVNIAAAILSAVGQTVLVMLLFL